MKLSLLFVAAAAFAQTPVVTAVRNIGLGDTSLAPLSLAYIYGAFPQGTPKDFVVTVGGQTGYVNAANSTGYITAVLPAGATLGTQPLVVSYQGAASAPFPVTLTQYAPEFISSTVVPATPTGPQFPLTSYFPIVHQNQTPVSVGLPAAPGERLVSLISGVGPTNPPVKLGGISLFEPLAVQPAVTVAGVPAQVVKAGSSGADVEVDFVIPANAPTGFYPVVLNVGGVPSNAVTIVIANGPIISAVLNAGSFRSAGTVAPGSIVSVFGAGFGPSDRFSTFPMSTINGTSISFSGTPSPVFAMAALEGQINILVPSELPTNGTVDLTIKDSSGKISAMALNLVPAVPGMFFYADPTVSTRRNAVALIANTARIAMPRSMGAAMGIPNQCGSIDPRVTCALPAQVGDNLQLFVTGLGKATPNGDPAGAQLPTGTVAPGSASPLYKTVDTPIVTIGGIPAPVQFSGIAPGFSGLYQINVQVPAGVQPGDDVPITLAMPGSPTDTATIAVQ